MPPPINQPNIPQQESTGNPFFMALFMTAILFCVLWIAAHDQIVLFFLGVLKIEAWFLNIASYFFSDKYVEYLSNWNGMLANTPAEDIDISTLWFALSTGGAWIRLPVALLCFAVGIWLFTQSQSNIYTRVMDFKQLKSRNAKLFPRMMPVADLDLVSLDPDEGPWARSMSPIRFSINYGLLKNKQGDKITEAKKEDVCVLDEEKTADVFSRQLGDAWPEDVEDLSPWAKSLLAVFISRICRDKKLADKILDQIGRTFKEGDSNTAHYMDLRIKSLFSDNRLDDTAIEKYFNDKKVQAVIKDHSHVNTTLSALLEAAREQSGILTSSDFIWLKPVDRTLHYALNQVGRRVAWSEASGIKSHLDAETVAGESLETPHIDTAVAGLKEALFDEGWIN